ncbi:hypothetical protein [uncultured Draconibacterium sp.]|uniref:hypothetical protein n=1 Tax=uncultured Draconibacterium sp. TaxID=1573823 RepID=UPI0025FBC810|nr:hypothetical protein [uncultured Draconibacterium sp.]
MKKPVFWVGASRIEKINRIRFSELFHLELYPAAFDCKYQQNYQAEMQFRIYF